MDKEKLNKAYMQIQNLEYEVGEAVWRATQEEINTHEEIGIGIICTLGQCNTKKEFDIADAIIVSVCGYGIDTLLNRIKAVIDDSVNTI